MAVEAGGIGARLRAGREKLGLTVLQVAERIHTDPKIVEAIEAENFAALGAPVYARGHIGHYAELVGESGSELNQLYSNVSKVAPPDLTRIVKAPAGTNSNKLVAPALLVIAVFAVAGAIWWVSALSKKKPQLSDTHVVGDETPAAGGIGAGAIGAAPLPPAPASEPAREPAPAAVPPIPADRGTPSGALAMQGGSSASAGASAPQRPAATSLAPQRSAAAPSIHTAPSPSAAAQARVPAAQSRTVPARPPPSHTMVASAPAAPPPSHAMVAAAPPAAAPPRGPRCMTLPVPGCSTTLAQPTRFKPWSVHRRYELYWATRPVFLLSTTGTASPSRSSRGLTAACSFPSIARARWSVRNPSPTEVDFDGADPAHPGHE
jgi:cytoskeleton protein RodZ